MHPKIAACTSASQHAFDERGPSTFVLGTATAVYAIAVLAMVAKLAGFASFERPPVGPEATAREVSHASTAKHAHDSTKPGTRRNLAAERADAVTGE